jgi:phage shock protein A
LDVDDDELRRLIEGTAAETRRHFDTVAERLETKVQLVAEGVLGNTELIRGLDRRAGNLETTVNQLDVKVSQLDVKVSKLDAKLDRLGTELEGRIERLEHSTN